MRHQLRIVSVEDDPKDAGLIQDLLETEGIVCEMTRVDTQASLLDLLQQGGVDLILADYSLPSFDGISALKLANKVCPDVPFIFVSGTLGEEVAIEALKIGATDYVLKTSLSRLVPSMQRALREATQKSERKRAEEALRQSETYLAEAQSLSHTGSFGWKPSTGEIIWSEETFRIFQYDRTTTPTVELVLQRVHPEDAALVQQTIERAAQEGKDFEHEYRLLMPDGSVKHVHVLARALSDESGSVEFVGAVTDITESRRAEESLRRSEGYLAEAQRLSHTGSFAGAPGTGGIRYWSEECYRALGFDPQKELPRFETFFQRIHPDDQARTMELLERASREKREFEFDYRIVHPGGQVRDIHTVGHPVFSQSGDLVEFVGTVIDITERKRAEDALRASENNLRQIVDSAPGLLCALSPAGKIELANRPFLEYFGKTSEELNRWSTTDVVHPDDLPRVIDAFTTSMANGTPFDDELRYRRADGVYRWFQVNIDPVRDADGRITGWYGLITDIEDRKQAEALRDGESRILEMIARDAPLQEILENLVRTVEAQFAGLLCSVLLLDEEGQHVRHGAAPSLPEAYIKAIDGLAIGPKAGSCGTAMYRREPVVVTDILQDPLWEPYRTVAEHYGLRACWSTPILAHSGKVLGSFAMYYREPRHPSPSENRALEMATHLAGIAIERKLAREERERLREAQADLAHISRVTTMGELTASLAHEIKQPISAAVTDARTCLRWLTRDDPGIAEAREAAARIVKDVTRAADIISSISLLFKKGARQRELVDVNELIREMIVMLRSEANRYSISIRTELAEGLPKVMAERVQLQQVFMNLMLNGVDAMKETTGGSELIIKSEVGDAQLLISVSDTGVGLPPERAEQIFRAFYTTKDNGTGMGLPISRSIIESHGGQLWAADHSARGAIFRFTLPTTVAVHA
jgi:PAS domain S-box-containing protein